MIVLDASTLVSASMSRGSVPDRALRHAFTLLAHGITGKGRDGNDGT